MRRPVLQDSTKTSNSRRSSLIRASPASPSFQLFVRAAVESPCDRRRRTAPSMTGRTFMERATRSISSVAEMSAPAARASSSKAAQNSARESSPRSRRAQAPSGPDPITMRPSNRSGSPRSFSKRRNSASGESNTTPPRSKMTAWNSAARGECVNWARSLRRCRRLCQEQAAQRAAYRIRADKPPSITCKQAAPRWLASKRA